MKEALKLALEMVQNKMYAHAEMYLKEALAQQSNEQVEPEFKLMPREATREMLEAMDECSMEGYERLYAGHAGSVYRAAWDAFAHPLVPTAQPKEPPVVAELLCVCGAEWEWRNRDWELVSTQPQQNPQRSEDINLSCKSTQARLAASWGYVKIEPLTHEQRFDLLTRFEDYKHEWHAHAILIDMVEAAHGIKGDA